VDSTQTFLTIDAVLRLALNLSNGLIVNPEVIERMDEIPRRGNRADPPASRLAAGTNSRSLRMRWNPLSPLMRTATMCRQPTRRFFLKASLACLASSPALAAIARARRADRKAEEKPPRFRFYAMDTGLVGPDVPTLEKKVALLKRLGFAGIGYTLNHRQLPNLLELLDKSGLELSAVYTTPRLEDKLDPELAGSIRRMKGRATRIELAITSRRFKPSTVEGDELGGELLRRVSDLAADTGPVVSVYPHRGFWTERVDDGLRLAKKVDRKNVGTHFNLVHWKWAPSKKALPDLLKETLPHLFAVTINGLKGDRIVSLEEGDYDIEGFVKLLVEVGYRGPVGLQGYGVAGPSAEHLGRSMKKWRDLLKLVEA
jgi:sugar phosphate isomerase/epimerase